MTVRADSTRALLSYPQWKHELVGLIHRYSEYGAGAGLWDLADEDIWALLRWLRREAAGC